jgi:uncharacterized protein (TIGR02147 family)
MSTIYDYLEYREYLADWFVAKKEANPRFSHRLFSRKMSQRSPSFLKDIIDGRRNITTDQQEDFCRVLGLSQAQGVYFIDLIILDQSKDDEERKRSFERLAASRRVQGARRVEGDSYRYLSNWFCPAIRELALIPGFVADPEWIINRLSPKIKKSQAREALDILQSLNMITIQDDRSVTVQDGTVATAHQISGIAVHNYHKQMLNLSIEAIDRFPSIHRHLVGVTVNVPNSLLPRLKEEINEFAARICDICDSSVDDSEEALQVNLHFYPLSATKDSE